MKLKRPTPLPYLIRQSKLIASFSDTNIQWLIQSDWNTQHMKYYVDTRQQSVFLNHNCAYLQHIQIWQWVLLSKDKSPIGIAELQASNERTKRYQVIVKMQQSSEALCFLITALILVLGVDRLEVLGEELEGPDWQNSAQRTLIHIPSEQGLNPFPKWTVQSSLFLESKIGAPWAAKLQYLKKRKKRLAPLSP